jgi:hypothetical protein
MAERWAIFLNVALTLVCSASADGYSSNVYGMDVLNRLQNAISSKGCVGGICVCSELNREWSGVFSSGVTLPSILARDPSSVDEAQEIQRAIRQVNRIADSMPRANRILDTCKWTRTLFSEKYFKLLEKMVQQTTDDAKVEAVKAAICELNEPVPDPEPVGDITEVPLFLLYLRYKQEYFTAKDELAQKVLKERESRTDDDFKKWYQDNLEILRCDVDSAYQKWEIFGNKRKVEDLLVENDIVADSSLITNSLGLYTAVRDLQPTTDNVAEGTMPVTLTPAGWEKILDSRTANTDDQLLFEIAEMKVREAELRGIKPSTKKANANKPLESTLNSTLNNVTILSQMIHNARVSCHSGKQKFCRQVILLQQELDTISDDFIQAYINFKAIETTEGLTEQIREVTLSIRKAEAELNSENSLSTIQALDIPQGVQQVSVTFNWTDNPENLKSTKEMMNLSDAFHKRPFLYLQSPPDEGCEGCYKSFHDEVIPEAISTKLYFLSMERSWFDPTVLQKAYMKKIISELEEPYAPSATSQDQLFEQLQRRSYLLPFYAVSIVIATDIEVTLRDVSNEAISDIYKGAWVSSPLNIGIGPFSVVNALEGTYSSQYRYNIENVNEISSERRAANGNRIKIRLGGGQIIGMQYQLMDSINTDSTIITAGPFNVTTIQPSHSPSPQ